MGEKKDSALECFLHVGEMKCTGILVTLRIFFPSHVWFCQLIFFFNIIYIYSAFYGDKNWYLFT